MKEVMLFGSYGTIVVGVKFEQLSDKVARFQIVEAVDYPQIDHNEKGEEIAVINYYNMIGPDGPAETFEEANLLASGSFVLQEEDPNPIVYTIEFHPGVIYAGKELESLVILLHKTLSQAAYTFLTGGNLPELEKVAYDFSNEKRA